MKLILALSALSALPAALACLQVSGQIRTTAGPPSVDSSKVMDNGAEVCNAGGGVQIDQDGHFTLKCLPGYIYAFTTDGKQAWYRNPVNAFSFVQSVKPERWGCFPQTDEPCAVVSWNQRMFGCPAVSSVEAVLPRKTPV